MKNMVKFFDLKELLLQLKKNLISSKKMKKVY